LGWRHEMGTGVMEFIGMEKWGGSGGDEVNGVGNGDGYRGEGE
jgi:hypothetical protein